ncbi:hypothetical protein BHE74_00058897 [Ensete ventricosum]|nr:hypothetical protein BHE74_00058897 [Ensete ventricosum]
MTNPLRERHHEDKQARKKVYRTKVGMAEFELRSTLATKVDGAQGKRDAWWVFCVCAPNLGSDESFGHQHMGAVYHRENRIGTIPTTRWRRPCMRVAICLSIDKGKLLREYRGVEAGGQKERGSDDESRGAQLPKCKTSVRKGVDSEECHSAGEEDLLIAKKGTQMQGNT